MSSRAPKGFKKKIKLQGKAVVRCLGFGAEHTFLSPDPRRVRRCPCCEHKLNQLNVSARAMIAISYANRPDSFPHQDI